MDRCPALRIWFAAYWQRNRAAPKPKLGDAHDWAFVPAVAYCDFALTERQLADFLHRGDRNLRQKVLITADELVSSVITYIAWPLG